MSKRIGTLIAAATIIVGSTMMAPHGANASTDPVRQFVSQLNAVRRDIGVGPVVLMPSLTTDAQGWSAAMASGACGSGRLCHRRDLVDVANRQVGSAWSLVGENVATLFATDEAAVADVVRRFEASPDHRANDHNSAYNEVGVAFATAPDGVVFITVEFLAADVPPPVPTDPGDLPARPIPPRGDVVLRGPFRLE